VDKARDEIEEAEGVLPEQEGEIRELVNQIGTNLSNEKEVLEELKKQLVQEKQRIQSLEKKLTEQTKLTRQFQSQVIGNQLTIKQLEEKLSKREQEITQDQSENESSGLTQIQSTNLPISIMTDEEKEKLNSFLQNYLILMKKEVGNCQLVINHEAATEKEKEHFIAEKKLLEYKIEQIQSFLKK
jgi:hypothetical protein